MHYILVFLGLIGVAVILAMSPLVPRLLEYCFSHEENDGSLAKAVKADYDLGLRINLTHTPTVVVVTHDQQQVVCGIDDRSDPSQILPVAEAAVASAHTAHINSVRSATSH